MTTPDITTDDGEGLAPRYWPAWDRFTLWCSDNGHRHLPATPDAVSAFLQAHPRTPLSTRRNWVTAINTAHRRHHYPPPGHSETVRHILNPARPARRAHLNAAIDAVLADLPTHGWVHGLFGRRDAALLVLVAAGLSFPAAARLQQKHLHISDDALTINEGQLRLPARPHDPACCPVQIMRRWAAVTNHAARPGGHHILAEHLTAGTLTDTEFDPRWAEMPALTAFTARGYPGGDITAPLHPLHPRSAAAITLAHLRGHPPHHRTITPHTEPDQPDQPPAIPETPFFDPNYFEKGIAARWRHQPIFDELDTKLTDLETLLDTLETKIGTATEVMSDADGTGGRGPVGSN